MKRLLLATLLLTSTATHAAWNVSGSTDPMTNEKAYYATSDSTSSLRPMGFPYEDTKSWVGVGCDGTGSKWVYFGFTNKPNMTDDDTKDGYSVAHRRIKWDDRLTSIRMTQSWGSDFIHASDDKLTIINLKKHSSVTLDMSGWHSAEGAYFTYGLAGATKAINSAFSKCGIK